MYAVNNMTFNDLDSLGRYYSYLENIQLLPNEKSKLEGEGDSERS